MHGLVVFALGVDDFNRFVFIDENALVADLSAHFTIERRVVEHEFVVFVFLLRHFSVTKNVAGVFGVVVAHELLFAGHQFRPVAVFDLCRIAGAVFLLLHFGIELRFVHRKTVFAANQFGQVEGEAVGVEQAESLHATQLLTPFTTHLLHRLVEQGNSLVERAQERVFLFLDDLSDERLLCFQFGEGVAHLIDEHGQQFVQKCLFLTEESIGVAHGTTQNSANHIACLRISGQLSVGNRERDGTQVVGTHAHGNVNLL